MKFNRGVFVTGTDTGVGKTWISLGIMARLQGNGYTVAAMKPVASGCARAPGGLINEDARRLMAQADAQRPYELVNPYAFEPAIAPNIAARMAGAHISLEKIKAAYKKVSVSADITVVEGVGGWLVPLNERETTADLALALNLPIILIVGLRLGCLNHALLSVESIQRHGAPLAGWVANHLGGRAEMAKDNVHALQKRIDAPLLGTVPFLDAFRLGDISRNIHLPILR